MNLPITNPSPDCNLFKRVILGQEIPKRPPFVELFLDQEILEIVVTRYLEREWVPLQKDRAVRAKYWDNYINAYHHLGYDFVWIDGKVNFPRKYQSTTNTAEIAQRDRVWDEEGVGAIASWEDFETYKWPTDEFDLWDYEYVSKHLPDGMGIFAFPCRGFLEVPLEYIMGYENFAMQLYDDPDLVKAICERVGETIMAFYRQIIGMENLLGFFPGDDMGFKTSTLIAPDDLRKYILPWHKKACTLAHDNNLLYLLHSCGNIEAIMDDLINDVKIDGKHSFEDSIMPVTEAKQRYGDRIAILGGVDIDKLCRLDDTSLREYVRNVLEVCTVGGRYALGTGNSVANYIPIEKYLIMLEEGIGFTNG